VAGGSMLPAVVSPAPDVDDERVRARWKAEQAKLPPGKRRTWDQAVGGEGEAMRGRRLRAPRASKRK
jgi:hypothetical protein